MPLTTSSRRGAFEAEKPIRCEHCGAMRPPRKVVREDGTPVEFNGIPAFWGHEDCGCPGAVAEREAIAEAERRKAAKEQAEAEKRAIERAGMPLRYRDAAHPYAAKMAALSVAGA